MSFKSRDESSNAFYDVASNICQSLGDGERNQRVHGEELTAELDLFYSTAGADTRPHFSSTFPAKDAQLVMICGCPLSNCLPPGLETNYCYRPMKLEDPIFCVTVVGTMALLGITRHRTICCVTDTDERIQQKVIQLSRTFKRVKGPAPRCTRCSPGGTWGVCAYARARRRRDFVYGAALLVLGCLNAVRVQARDLLFVPGLLFVMRACRL
jgi:hypothetical protein